MGITKAKRIETLNKNPDNWMCFKCVVCNKTVRVNIVLEGIERLNNNICPECLNNG